jgi:flagellar hook-basal body complex protein FliE
MQIPALQNVTAPSLVLPPNPNAGAAPGSAASTGSFSDLLMQQVSHLNDLQLNAQDQSQALATGQASDVSAVVTAVEQASLAMQLAVQVRNKATDAYQEIMRMQI